MTVIIRNLGLQQYQKVWHQMLDFTNKRTNETKDEIWLVEHYPIFTQGKSGTKDNLFYLGDIPLIQSDRGGQITYHGPGQLIVYLLLDLTRLKIGVKKLVSLIEKSIIETLEIFNIYANTLAKKPGVYVNQDKIASLGLKIKHGFSLHGLSLNVAMDLTPFSQIRPCGLNNIGVTQMKNFVKNITINQVSQKLIPILTNNLNQNVPKNLHK